ncbi:hypothetical protein [Desulfogranum marinum]|uniref:hypothetical protein n=1 Tax=Desulfogranum marinum TaxID=453220 RepID=UPI0029C718E2|nr:hypothetical protein [Desulfogranum marinum]
MSAELILALINGFFAIVSAWIGSSRSLPGLPDLPIIKEETLIKIISLLGYLLLASFICFLLELKYLLFLQCFLFAGIVSIFLASYAFQNSLKNLALVSSIVFTAIIVTLVNIHVFELVINIKGSLIFFTPAPILGIVLVSIYISATYCLRKSIGLPPPKPFYLLLGMSGLMKRNNEHNADGQKTQSKSQQDR